MTSDASSSLDKASLTGKDYLQKQGDTTLSEKYYLRSAQGIIAEAEYSIVLMYEFGEGTDRNLERAQHWYDRAEKHGYEMAKNKVESTSQSGKKARLP